MALNSLSSVCASLPSQLFFQHPLCFSMHSQSLRLLWQKDPNKTTKPPISAVLSLLLVVFLGRREEERLWSLPWSGCFASASSCIQHCGLSWNGLSLIISSRVSSLPPCFPWPPALLWMPDLCRGSSCLSPLIVFWLRWLFVDAFVMRPGEARKPITGVLRREGNHSSSLGRERGPGEPCLVNPLKNKAGCSLPTQSRFWRSLRQHQAAPFGSSTRLLH